MNWEQRYNEQTEVAALLAKQRDDALARIAELERKTKTCDSSNPCLCVDDDLNEPLGEPACQLGGECDSCQ